MLATTNLRKLLWKSRVSDKDFRRPVVRGAAYDMKVFFFCDLCFGVERVAIYPKLPFSKSSVLAGIPQAGFLPQNGTVAISEASLVFAGRNPA